MESITDKMKEVHGEGDAIFLKQLEKQNYRFYLHPTGFSLYRYDTEVEKEIALFSEHGCASWHFVGENAVGENHEKVEPTEKFWEGINFISRMVFEEEQEKIRMIAGQLMDLLEELEYHEKKLLQAINGSVNEYGEEFIGQEEIVGLLHAGEREV